MRQLITAIFLISAPAQADLVAGPDARQTIAAVDAPAPALEVTVRLDREDGRYRVGDEVQLTVSISDDAYVTVVDVGSSGEMHIIFPNAFQVDNRLNGGESVVLGGPQSGYAFTVNPPAGTELVKVFASRSDEALVPEQVRSPAGPFSRIDRSPATFARDISVILSRDVHDGWADAEVEFQIEAMVPDTEGEEDNAQ